jgi:hypothetical protein
MGSFPPPRPTPRGFQGGGSVIRAQRAHFAPLLAGVSRSVLDRIRSLAGKTGSGPGRGCWVVIFLSFISRVTLFLWITSYFVVMMDLAPVFIVDNFVDSLWIVCGPAGFL